MAKEARCASLAIIISYPTSVSGIIYFIKNSQEILLDLADFVLQEQPEDNLVVAISLAWYKGSYTMTAKPIKFLELLCFAVSRCAVFVSSPQWCPSSA